MRLELADVHLGLRRETERVIVCQQRGAKALAQAVEGSAQRLLSGASVEIRPEECQQVLARDGPGMGREVIDDGAALAARQGERLLVQRQLRRAKQANS